MSGLLYSAGHGCERDETQARRWLQRAKRQNLGTFQTLQGVSVVDVSVDDVIATGVQIVSFETTNQLKTGVNYFFSLSLNIKISNSLSRVLNGLPLLFIRDFAFLLSIYFTISSCNYYNFSRFTKSGSLRVVKVII